MYYASIFKKKKSSAQQHAVKINMVSDIIKSKCLGIILCSLIVYLKNLNLNKCIINGQKKGRYV